MSRAFHLLETNYLSLTKICDIFSLADRFRQEEVNSLGLRGNFPVDKRRAIAALLFFEPSTRTRASFTVACYRLGMDVLPFEANEHSSMSKGETVEDTIENILALNPDVLVVRAGEALELEALANHINIPFINAGWGSRAHPSQALLDAYTIEKQLGSVQSKKVLIAGDVSHSRVAQSNIETLLRLGAEVSTFDPFSFQSSAASTQHLETAMEMEDVLPAIDVYMGLRIQKERHQGKGTWINNYLERFGLNEHRLSLLNPNAIIMHPGPINYGSEFCLQVKEDPRNRVYEQVRNGVFVRMSLLQLALESL